MSARAFAKPKSCTSNGCVWLPPPRAAAAVYDSTLNFRNNDLPSLLDILNGKKYHADLYVR